MCVSRYRWKRQRCNTCIGVEKEKVIAYARILNSNLSNPKFVSIGRITILKKKRKGMATNLSNFVLELLIKDGQQKKLKSLHKHT